MLETLKKEWTAQIIVIIYLLLTGWWFFLLHLGFKDTSQNLFFAAVYGILAFLGGTWGLIIAHKWGGWKSTVGRALIFLSLGLFAEEFGQLVFSYYNIFLKVEVPYPSLADIGFFGNIPFYVLGVLHLGYAAGIKFSLKKFTSQLQFIAIPVIGLSLSYYFFLKDYKFDFSNPLKMFLDFGYPLGQALYISIAIVVFSLSNGLLGGIMKNKVLFILVGFVVQYLSDYNFLFQSNNQTWVNGGYGDYLYLLSYAIMAYGLIQFDMVYKQLRKSS